MERNLFGKEPLLEIGMESLQCNLEDLSEGGSQYVGYLKFEMISISLLSKYQIEPIFHKCSFALGAASTGRRFQMLTPSFSLTLE